MHEWMATLGLLSATGTWGSYALSPPDTDGSFDQPPVVQWVTPLPAPPLASATHTERGGPVIHGDRIYIGAAATDALLVLDRRDGRLLQRLPASGPVQAPAVITDTRVIFSDVSGTTWCYPLGSDEPLWKHYSGAPILSPPTVEAGSVYLSNVDDQVYALSVADGELRWRYAHPSDPGRLAELELYGAPSPVLAGDVVLAGFSDGALIALSVESGDAAWSRRVGPFAFNYLVACRNVTL